MSAEMSASNAHDQGPAREREQDRPSRPAERANPEPDVVQPDAAQTDAEKDRPAPDPRQPVLMVMIMASPVVFDDIVTALLEFGVQATVVQSKGLMAMMREEMPIFSGLASLLPGQTGSRVLMSVTTTATAAKVFEFLEHDLAQADRPIAFTISLDGVIGLRD
jgi:hypothetical protein